MQKDCAESETLIPGLPDDLALLCLLRTPIDEHACFEEVSDRWRSVFKTQKRFFELRNQYNVQEPWIFVLAYHRTEFTATLKVFNVKDRSWHSISVPQHILDDSSESFNGVSVPEQGSIFLFIGNSGTIGGESTRFAQYDVCNNSWRIIKEIATSEDIYPVITLDGKIYITSTLKKHEKDKNYTIHVFDPKNNEWGHIPAPANKAYDPNHCVSVFEGKLLLPSRDKRFSSVSYDPKCNEWEDMNEELARGIWDGSCGQVLGHMFVLEQYKTGKLKFFDAARKRWIDVKGMALPGYLNWPYRVEYYEDKIFVVKEEFEVVMGTISKEEDSSCSCDSMPKFQVHWEAIDTPRTFRSFQPCCAKLIIA